MADSVAGAKTSADKTNNAAIDAQKDLIAESMRVNIAMAYLQMALSLTGKISGR